MTFAASEFHGYYQPEPCALRVYLQAKGIKAAEPDGYHQLLAKLGERHERRHLNQLGPYFHAHGDVEKTKKAFLENESIIYQPAMRIRHAKYGEAVGVPDFFIRENAGYVIRDCKLSHRFNENDHPEIFRQLELYGWLYEQTFDSPPVRLEAVMGDGQIHIIPYLPARALEILDVIQKIKQLSKEPFEPVGWSKCLSCGYNDYCWRRSKETHAVGMLPGVDQALVLAFHEQNLISYDELLSKYDEGSLGEMQKEVGGKLQKVGGAARKIMNHAKAFQTGKMIRLKAPDVKKAPNLVMFDVEGIPPYLDYSERTYLWGLKVFGEKPRAYSPAVATATPEGDCDGWQKFLGDCGAIFAAYGSIPFVHWSSYEKTQLSQYVKKCGDREGVASRVLENLHDLLPIIENAFVLPTPSYGLKLIEKIAGYKRMLTEAGGKWSMATYIEAIETDDPDQASRLMSNILKYNEEDLDAMWFVYKWIAGHS